MATPVASVVVSVGDRVGVAGRVECGTVRYVGELHCASGTGLWYGVDPLQPWLYVGSAVLIVAVTLAASGRPALRAARVDASRLLR